MTSPEPNTSNETSPVQCPAGIKDCAIAEEVNSLREDVVRLSEAISTDTLTGLSNYRFFLQSLAQELERTQRSGQPTSLMMIDIDHFKQVNDTWGHETGNKALKHVAKSIRQTVRRLDIPCRYGGEEFAVILPDTGLQASIQVAERIRTLIAESPLPHGDQQLSFTVSIGIATYQLNSALEPEELIENADKFLYQAKQEGRNRTCHAQPASVELISSEERQELSALFGQPARKKDPS